RRYTADGVAAAPEFQVNTWTPDAQYHPDVAMAPDGRAVVVWADGALLGAHDGAGFGIFGQRLDVSGNRVGAEFPINSFVLGNQDDPTAAMDSAGNFVVDWQSDGQLVVQMGIYARRFAADASPLDDEFR